MAVHLEVRHALSGNTTRFEADEAMTIAEIEWRLDLQRQRRGMQVEKRVAPDGNAYTREAFKSFYDGDLSEWEAAPQGGNPDHLKARLCLGPDKLASSLTVAQAGLVDGDEVQLVLTGCRGCALQAVSRCWENLVGYPDREETEAEPGDVQGVAQEVGLLPALRLLADAEQLPEDEQRLLYLTAEAIMRLANGDAAVAADSSREAHAARKEVTPGLAEAEATVPEGLLDMFGGFADVSMIMCLRPNEVERFVGSAGRLRTCGAELGFLVLAPTAARKCMGADLRRLTGAVEAILCRWAGKVQVSEEMAGVLHTSLGALLLEAERMGLPDQVDAVMQVLRKVAPTVYRALVTTPTAEKGGAVC